MCSFLLTFLISMCIIYIIVVRKVLTLLFLYGKGGDPHLAETQGTASSNSLAHYTRFKGPTWR